MEYLDAVAFYEERKRGLGLNFMAEIHSALEFIAESPKRQRIEVQPNIRVYLTARFPHQICYRQMYSNLGCSTYKQKTNVLDIPDCT